MAPTHADLLPYTKPRHLRSVVDFDFPYHSGWLRRFRELVGDPLIDTRADGIIILLGPLQEGETI